MGQDAGAPAGGFLPVGQGMGRYQEGTAPQIGNDPKAKAAPSVPGSDLAGLSGLPGSPAASGMSPNPDMLKTLIAQLLHRGKR